MSELTPLTRQEVFLAAMGGQEVTPPEPLTREEMFLGEVIERIDEIPDPTQEQVTTAVNEYLDEHSIVFNTSAEIPEVLEG